MYWSSSLIIHLSSHLPRDARNGIFFHWNFVVLIVRNLFTHHWLILALMKEQRHKKSCNHQVWQAPISIQIFPRLLRRAGRDKKNYSPANRLTTPLKKIMKSWIFMTRNIKLIFYIHHRPLSRRYRTPFVTICHYTIDSWEYKTKELASHRGGC